MSLFYDSLKKKVKPWALALFVIVPIVLIIFGFIYGQGAVEKKSQQMELEAKPDIFD